MTHPVNQDQKIICMFHGGKSTEPATLDSIRRCAETKTIHGRETRVIRNVRAKKLAELKFYLKILA